MKRLGISIISLVAAFPALAQDIALDEIVFSANLVPQALSRTGVSVTVIGEDELRAAGDQRLSSFLESVPGVSVTQQGPLGTTAAVRIRGTDPQYTAVYIDGIRVDDPAAVDPSFDFGMLSTAGLSRIEVLKGTQSALYGGSAVGGVINITTLPEAGSGTSQRLQVEMGSYGTRALSYVISHGGERGGMSFSLGRVKTDGFSAYDTLPRTPGLEADGFDGRRANLSFRQQVTDTVTVGGSAFIQDSTAEYDAFGADDALNRQERLEKGGRLYLEAEAGNVTHTFDVAAYSVLREYFEPAGWSPYSFFDAKRLSFSYQGESEMSEALRLIWGADTSEETSRTATSPVGNSTRVSGAYVQGIWAPAEGLDLSATLRRDQNSRYGGFTSGRVALAWQASPDLTLRGAIGRGFRAPSLFHLFGEPLFGIGPNAALTPETSTSYEIGFDWTGQNGAQVSGTLFQTEIDNLINYCGAFASACVTPIPAGFTNLYENVPGVSTRKGVELAAEFPLGEILTLDAGYTYVDARTATGARVARVPRHDLSVGLSAAFDEKWSGGVRIQHIGGRTGGMPDYTVANARVSYVVNDAASLTLRVENLLDKDYQEVTGYATPGRSVYLGLDARF